MEKLGRREGRGQEREVNWEDKRESLDSIEEILDLKKEQQLKTKGKLEATDSETLTHLQWLQQL